MQKNNKIDYLLLIITFGLLAFGLTALYSASTVESIDNFGNTTRYIFHQLAYGVGAGLISMFILSKVDYKIWQKLLPLIVLFSLLLLAMVKIPAFSFSSGGASRWIHVGPIFFQPSELAKLALVMYLAAWSTKKAALKENFIFGLLPSLIIVGLFSLLFLSQPDFGTMSILVGTAAIMFFASGVKLKHFFLLAVCGLLAVALLIKFEPYRAQRLTSFLNPTIDPQGSSYQINQSLLAIGAGGVTGYGYGLSRQKYNYLPEPMGDSIFAITAEELGFVRVIFVLVLFISFFLRARKISLGISDPFGRMVILGVSSWITLQAIINIGSMVGLLPLTGVPLPFFSYGSSALLITMSAVGIVLSVSRSYKQ